MVCVKVFRSKRRIKLWQGVINILKKENITVLNEVEETDVSIVLSGPFENPVILKGKKILLYDCEDWMEGEKKIPPRRKFNFFRQYILDEYYDEFVDCTDMTDEEKAKEVIRVKNEVERS